MGVPTFVPLEQWADNPKPIRSVNRPPHDLYRAVVIHHSAGPLNDQARLNPVAAFKQVERAALGRRNKSGSPMFAMIPYSYLLHLESGVIGVGRGGTYGDGGTRITKPHRDRTDRKIKQGETISICVAGNYHPGKLRCDKINIEHLQAAILAVVFRHAARLGEGWSLLRHRDLSATECCGDLLAKVVLAIRSDVYAGRMPKAKKERTDALSRAVDAGLLPPGSVAADTPTMADLAHLALALTRDR